MIIDTRVFFLPCEPKDKRERCLRGSCLISTILTSFPLGLNQVSVLADLWVSYLLLQFCLLTAIINMT